MPTASPLKHICPQCVRTFSYPEKAAGKIVDCPACKERIRLPGEQVVAGNSVEVVSVPKTVEPTQTTCPFCAETIQAKAIKCKHCGSSIQHDFSPQEPIIERAPLSSQKVFNIARNQNYLIWAILMQLALIITPLLPFPFGFILLIAAIVVQALCVFSLAISVFGTELGIVLGILSLVPCFGLIILLVINTTATSRLSEAGWEVGFMGVSKDDLEKIRTAAER